jgi:hypothetical protein
MEFCMLAHTQAHTKWSEFKSIFVHAPPQPQKKAKKNLPLSKSADRDKEIHHHQPSSPATTKSFSVTQTLP